MIVAGSTNPLLMTSAGGYNLTRSLRFRSSASAYLNRTPSSAGNRQKWTVSFWCKRGTLGTNNSLMQAGTTSNQITILFFGADDKLYFHNGVQGTSTESFGVTSAVYRDPSAWYHIVFGYDTTQATASNRVFLYVNGVAQTLNNNGANYYPSQNYNTATNNTVAQYFGYGYTNSGIQYLDTYLTEVNFIDGQALTPSSFGETSATTGVWQPKRYTGTYGTNGFYLPFTDNSALTTSSNAGLGKDFSGNGNYWTTNNISITSGSTYDSMTDVPTLTSATASNFCVMNPVSFNGSTLSEGNLLFAGANLTNARATFAMPSSGLFYWEVTPTTTMPNYVGFGLIAETVNGSATAGVGATGLWGVYPSSNLYTSLNGTGQTNTGISTPALGCTFAVAYDCSTGKIWFGYASSGAGSITWIGGGNPATGSTPTGTISTSSQLFPFLSSNNGTSDKSAINFGQRPFAYTPPTGFVALNTYNLPTPTIGATASSQANKYFDATTYTGTGSSLSVTNSGSMQPDFVWLKNRSSATYHWLTNAITGTSKQLTSNATDAESSYTQILTAFNSNGFTVGTDGDVNANGSSYVGWQWKANGTGVTNTAGSITSTVSANTTSGFSVVTYTGNGSNATVGHGLGVAPKMVIVKGRSFVSNWNVFHKSVFDINSAYTLALNSTTYPSGGGSPTIFNSTAPTSSVFSIGTSSDINTNGSNYVAYCFSEVAGFSKFTSYTGNGSSDGPFIFCGFRPAFVMIKSSSSGENWIIYDNRRLGYNLTDKLLFPNTSGAEETSNGIDILSNGFKLRASTSGSNANGGTYIVMAFAENPFKYSLAR